MIGTISQNRFNTFRFISLYKAPEILEVRDESFRIVHIVNV